jgi:hypothetical protein
LNAISIGHRIRDKARDFQKVIDTRLLRGTLATLVDMPSRSRVSRFQHGDPFLHLTDLHTGIVSAMRELRTPSPAEVHFRLGRNRSMIQVSSGFVRRTWRDQQASGQQRMSGR